MNKIFSGHKIFTGDDRRHAVPLCYNIGRAVLTYAAERLRSPFIIVSRDGNQETEPLQLSVGDAICASGGEVLLADHLSVPAAALLTRKYRADFAVTLRRGAVEILDGGGCNLPRTAEAKIEKILLEGAYCTEERKPREGEMYCRRDAYIDYCGALAEAAGARKIPLKMVADCAHGDTAKAAPLLFSRLTKHLFIYNTGDPADESETPVGELVRRHGADLGFCFDPCGRAAAVSDARGEDVPAEELYCLIAAKMAGRDIYGRSGKQQGKGIKLGLGERGAVHFADILPGPDALFTALVLSLYLADKDAPLHELVRELKKV